MRDFLMNVKAVFLSAAGVLLFGGSFGVMYVGDFLYGVQAFLAILGALCVLQKTREMLRKEEVKKERKSETDVLLKEVKEKYFK
jgi:hypothetical protein